MGQKNAVVPLNIDSYNNRWIFYWFSYLKVEKVTEKFPISILNTVPYDYNKKLSIEILSKYSDGQNYF